MKTRKVAFAFQSAERFYLSYPIYCKKHWSSIQNQIWAVGELQHGNQLAGIPWQKWKCWRLEQSLFVRKRLLDARHQQKEREVTLFFFYPCWITVWPSHYSTDGIFRWAHHWGWNWRYWCRIQFLFSKESSKLYWFPWCSSRCWWFSQFFRFGSFWNRMSSVRLHP